MADLNGELTAPLIDSEVAIDVNGLLERGTDAALDESPYAFLGAPPLELPPMSPIDPFRNQIPSISGMYEWCKTVLCLPIAAARLVLFGIAIAVGYVATLVALYGWNDKQNPMPRWRCRAMWLTRLCARLILFSFGYQWIKRKGRPAPREIAPIVVCNHISYIEPIFFFYELIPTMVASESHDSLPFVGTIVRAMQVIYVDRFSPQSRKLAIHEIKRKASSNDFPRVMLFPEGTTTNGRFLISFRLGAFLPGLPLQPVVVRYPYVHFDQSWGNVNLLKLMFRMFTQFHNFMEVEYLPVIFPDESKQQNITKFSDRTSNAMSRALNVLQTTHSFGDMILFSRASELGKERCSNYMVEMGWVENSFNISTSEAVVLLDKFLAMDPDSNGRVQIYGFLKAYGLCLNPLGEKIFGYLDTDKKGSITFRQFLTGSALIRKQPSFWRACETAFAKCCENSTDCISTEQLHQLFDTTADGVIRKDEFMECLQKNPLLIALFSTHLKTDDQSEIA
ncbi:lysophospholipid acyltransferase LPEAT2-like [Zingiber officinale]|uniref:lysophospholipid acyltransferase LPEAT2-like n=1 Tax=Zingiber officinale TaxID=94328 RepID=UPI001C4C015B|nr:lysophospholipid acyltransferase LPEAT2-like [Zingiber officinale]